MTPKLIASLGINTPLVSKPRHLYRLAIASVSIGLVLLAVLAMFRPSSAGIILLTVFGPTLVAVGLLTGILATKLGRLEELLDTKETLLGTKLEQLEASLIRGMKLAKEFETIGLAEVAPDASLFDYLPIMLDSQRLVIVLNDGRTWTSQHRDRLRRRVADPNKETTVFLINPRSSMISVLARKGSKDEETLRRRIWETVEILSEMRQDGSNLEILGHYLFNPSALVLGDKCVVITPYYASRGGRTLPAWKFEDIGEGCYFRTVEEDIEHLRMDAETLQLDTRDSKNTGHETFRLIHPSGS